VGHNRKAIIQTFGYKDGTFIQFLIDYSETIGATKGVKWITPTQEEIRESTRMSTLIQRGICDRLKMKGIIDVRREGMPARNKYKLNIKKINETIKRKEGE